SAVRQNTFLDYLAMTGAVIGISAPTFWIGLLLILVFALKLGWIPGMGYGDGRWIYLVLPAVTLATRPMALLARITRSAMLETIRQDYIRTARAKGLSEWAVTVKHALRNALIPVVTILGTETAAMLGGVVVTETVFAWPGLGRLFVEALTFRDYPIIRGQVLFLATVFIVANLIVDLSYALFDPRIRYERGVVGLHATVEVVAATATPEVVPGRSLWSDARRRFFRNKLAVLGLIIVVGLVLVAIFAPYIAPYDPLEQLAWEDFSKSLAPPSWEHPFGTDLYGR